MVIRAFCITAACLALAGTPSRAAAVPVDGPTVATLEAGLAGHWRGALGYRDYQTDKLSELPVTTEIQALADGATVIRISAFDDGPKTGTVYITTVSLFDTAKHTVASVSLRKGNKAEVETEATVLVDYKDPAHWTIRYEANGSDNDKPAKLRVIETRSGSTLLAVKDVLPADSADGKWRFRNQTRLEKLP